MSKFLKGRILLRVVSAAICAAMFVSMAACGRSQVSDDPDDEEEPEIIVIQGEDEEDCDYCGECDWCLEYEEQLAQQDNEAANNNNDRSSRSNVSIPTLEGDKQTVQGIDDLRGKKMVVAWAGGTFFGNEGNDPDGRKATRQAAIDRIDAEFGCEFVARDIPGGAFALLEVARPIIYAGSFFSDIMVSWVHRIGTAVDLQLWKDLNRVPEMQMDNPKWDLNMTEQTKVFGKNLFVFPDFKSPAYTANCLMFNKRILGEVGMTSAQLYQMVRERKWTFQEMQRISARAYKDIDGVPGASVGDQFGFVGVDMPGGVAKHVFLAAGGQPTTRTSDGGFRNNMENMKNISALTTMASWLTSDRSVMNEQIDQRIWERQTDAFMQGRALFYLSEAYRLPDANYSASDGWGMVPFPTSKAGEDYKSGINHNTEVIAIPSNSTLDSSALAGYWLNEWIEGYSQIFAADLATTISRITDPDAATIIEMNELIKKTGNMDPLYWGVISPGGNMIRLYRREETDAAQSVKAVNFDLQVNNFLAAVRAVK
ncbi:MAG: hypothetical protein FWH14_00870 [Oscillospiraceae bacterium]|nr:hypothetical protein [Oscillospiraceae bacterium]